MSHYDLDFDPSEFAAPRRYRCGGYASWSGHCGALDCDTCYPGNRHGEPEDTDLSRRLDAAGYEHDGEGGWSKVVSRRTRVARRDHADGKVRKGDRYVETVTRDVDEKGRSQHRRSRRVLVAPR